MVSRAESSHIGSCLSVSEIIAVLEFALKSRTDSIIFSKGHAAAAYYSALAGVGKLPVKKLLDFCLDGSELTGHINHLIDGVSFSTGSLGHGLPLGIGVALADQSGDVYVVMSDGELNEGTTWESLAIAKHLKVNNLTLVVDANGVQSFGSTADVMNLEPLIEKFNSFGWSCREVDGHSIEELAAALLKRNSYTPRVIIARTTKGKGVKSMENKLEWHYKYPSRYQLDEYIKEVEEN